MGPTSTFGSLSKGRLVWAPQVQFGFLLKFSRGERQSVSSRPLSMENGRPHHESSGGVFFAAHAYVYDCESGPSYETSILLAGFSAKTSQLCSTLCHP